MSCLDQWSLIIFHSLKFCRTRFSSWLTICSAVNMSVRLGVHLSFWLPSPLSPVMSTMYLYLSVWINYQLSAPPTRRLVVILVCDKSGWLLVGKFPQICRPESAHAALYHPCLFMYFLISDISSCISHNQGCL